MEKIYLEACMKKIIMSYLEDIGIVPKITMPAYSAFRYYQYLPEY